MTGTTSLADLRGLTTAVPEGQETLGFDPKAATIAIQACSSLVGHLRTVQESLNAESLDGAATLRDFAGPPDVFGSGRDWSEAFRQLGRDLSDRITSHINVVTQLSELYRAAATEYARAEQESEEAFRQAISGFDGITIPASANGSIIVPKFNNDVNSQVKEPDPVTDITKTTSGSEREGTRTTTSDQKRVYGDYQPPSDSRAVWPENPFSKSWNDFYSLGQNIFSTAVISAASHWEDLRTRIETAASDFNTEISQTQTFWKGYAAGQARKTVGDYLSDLKKLNTSMGEIKTRLVATAGWLRSTRKEMPDVPEPDVATTEARNGTTTYEVTYKGRRNVARTPKAAVEVFLQEIQFACESYYVAGIVEYNSSLSSLSLPQLTVQMGTVTPPIITDVPNVNGNPTVTNGAPTVTAGSPGTTPNVPPEITNVPQDQAPTTPNPDSPTPTDPSTTTDTTGQVLQSLLQQGAQLAQSVVEQGTQAVQQGLQTAQQIAQQAAQLAAQQPTIPTPTIPTTTPSPTGTQPTVTGGGSPTTTSTPIDPSRTTQSRLFPRASISDTTTAQTSTVARAGLASASATTSGTSGMPMMGSPGAAGAGQQGSDKEHKRPAYLRSGGHLEDVFDAEPVSANAVVERGK